MTDDRGVWVYAIAREVAGGWLGGIAGLDGQPVRAVRAAGLAAALTTVRLAEFGEAALRRHLDDRSWLERAAQAHHLVIETLAAHGPAVPMRLATVYTGDAGVAALLTARGADFSAALDRVDGRSEWAVKVYPVARREPAEAGAAARAAGRPTAGAGAAYLSRRRQQLSAAEQSRQAAVASAEHIHATLARLAVAAQLRSPQAPQLSGRPDQMIMNGAYLVDGRRAEAFAAAAADLAAGSAGVRVELTGPWPPYSFATVPEVEVAR